MMDIEDLVPKTTKKILKIDEEMINNNFQIYQNIIQELYNFYRNKQDLENFQNHFNNLYNKLSKRKDGIIIKKVYLVYVYRKLIEQQKIENDPIFWPLIQKCPARNLSGVNSFAILLSPHPSWKNKNKHTETQQFSCKHNCYYCPNETIANGSDADMPRSYLKKEPAVARGFEANWDAITQMNIRMNSLLEQGHIVDKLELILEGGTYTEYPQQYLEEFHRDIFYSANTFFDCPHSKRNKLDLKNEMFININAKVRIIGICIETRPDALNEDWIYFFRNTGVTRIQLGVQHTDNKILKKINRGHSFEQSKYAMKLLKDNCFKVDIHLMPDLPNSTPEIDKKMFDQIYNPQNDESYQPDQIKIYPCEITPYTIISKWYSKGLYRPYSEVNINDLHDVVAYGIENCPPWIRLPRVVRDIPLSYIIAGNKLTNLRQIVQDKILASRGVKSQDLRSREIGRNKNYKFDDAKYIIRQYSNKQDFFISLESPDKQALFGFVRLRINENDNDVIFSELKNKGLIRELHVYNNLLSVGDKTHKKASQHRGIGKKLISMAEDIAYKNGKEGVAIISGEGVKGYYFKLGYKQGDYFLIKNFDNSFTNIIYMILTIFIFLFIIIY